MTLESTLRTGIAELPAGRSTFSAGHGPWQVRLSVERRDGLGCLLWDVSLRRDTPAAADAKVWAEQLAQRVTGLLEPLKLHEADAGRQLTLLRSTAPTAREGASPHTST